MTYNNFRPMVRVVEVALFVYFFFVAYTVAYPENTWIQNGIALRFHEWLVW